jgi:nitrogen regulatory protein PII-like uncharacterized protein
VELAELSTQRPDKFRELRKLIEDHENRLLRLEGLIEGAPEVAKRKLSVKELILQKQAKTDLAKTVVIGYYLEQYKHVSPFSIRDLVEMFKEAKEPVPKNLNDAVNKNIEKGLIMESEDKKNQRKSWTLTSTGERYVENDLGEEK